MKISLNGVEVELEKCGHCGVEATEADVAKALKHEEVAAPVCAVCQKRASLTKAKVTHHFYGDEHRWLIEGTREPMVNIYSYCGDGTSVDGNIHLECLKKVAPGIRIMVR